MLTLDNNDDTTCHTHGMTKVEETASDDRQFKRLSGVQNIFYA